MHPEVCIALARERITGLHRQADQRRLLHSQRRAAAGMGVDVTWRARLWSLMSPARKPFAHPDRSQVTGPAGKDPAQPSIRAVTTEPAAQYDTPTTTSHTGHHPYELQKGQVL